MADQTTYTTDSYFETQERPASLDAEVSKVRDWVTTMKSRGKRIVLVTVSLPPFFPSLLCCFRQLLSDHNPSS